MTKIKPNKTDKGMFYNFSYGDWKEANYVETKKNAIRGGHYHKVNRECFFILSGKVQFTIQDTKTGAMNEFTVTNMECITIEPFVTHWLLALEDSSWVSLNSLAFNPKNPDIHDDA